MGGGPCNVNGPVLPDGVLGVVTLVFPAFERAHKGVGYLIPVDVGRVEDGIFRVRGVLIRLPVLEAIFVFNGPRVLVCNE